MNTFLSNCLEAVVEHSIHRTGRWPFVRYLILGATKKEKRSRSKVVMIHIVITL